MFDPKQSAIPSPAQPSPAQPSPAQPKNAAPGVPSDLFPSESPRAAHPTSFRVAIQGELGSNSHMAALQAFPDDAIELIACATSAEVFEQLASGQTGLAVLPIENSLHGSVFEHYDLLLESRATIVGELQLHIRHNVIAAPGAALAQIRRILSHPVALSQCRRWLRQHPHIEVVPFYDTAGSVKHLMATGAAGTAGLAPALAAKQYGAEVLVAGVEDHAENYTRFYILSSQTSAPIPVPQPPPNKASLAFSLEHRPGSLIAALEVFREAELNLTKIESRPVPGSPWEYIFFVDLRFPHAAGFDRALESLRQRCQTVRELGRYRAARNP